MSRELLIVHGLARQVALKVEEIRHHCPSSSLPLKRQVLRLWGECTLGTIRDLLKHIDQPDAPRSMDEKVFISRVRAVERDIRTMLDSVDCLPD